MIKLIRTTLVITLSFIGSMAAHAQGRIQFSIPSTQRIIFFGTGAPLFAPAGTFEYGLYIGAAGSTAAQMTLVGVTLNPASTSAASPTAGLFNGTNPFLIPATPGVTLDGSVPIAFMIKGWEASLGSSYEAAYAAIFANPNLIDANSIFGNSVLGSITPTLSPTAAPAIFGTGPGQIQSFTMGIPEPSTYALGGLGAVTLMLFRRRK